MSRICSSVASLASCTSLASVPYWLTVQVKLASVCSDRVVICCRIAAMSVAGA